MSGMFDWENPKEFKFISASESFLYGGLFGRGNAPAYSIFDGQVRICRVNAFEDFSLPVAYKSVLFIILSEHGVSIDCDAAKQFLRERAAESQSSQWFPNLGRWAQARQGTPPWPRFEWLNSSEYVPISIPEVYGQTGSPHATPATPLAESVMAPPGAACAQDDPDPANEDGYLAGSETSEDGLSIPGVYGQPESSWCNAYNVG